MGTFFCVTGLLWGVYTSHRLIPLTMASDVELWYFLWSALERKAEQTIKMLMIWDAIALIKTSIWCVATKIWHPHILGLIHMIPKYSKYSKWQSYNILICIGSLSVVAEAKYDLSSVRSSGIHLSAILQEISQPSVTEISCKITYLNFLNLPGANELITSQRKFWDVITHPCHILLWPLLLTWINFNPSMDK